MNLNFPDGLLEGAEEVVQTDLEGLNAAKFVAKAELATRHRSGCRTRRSTGRQRFVVTQADEHVLALDTPAVSERPFQATADCIRCKGVATSG